MEESGWSFPAEAAPYGALARWYDAFTEDVPYAAFADYYTALLEREGRGCLTLLDLCCGTGAMTLRLAQRGHEMIGVDRSPEMLSLARAKAEALSPAPPVAPLFLCQAAEELDLYGTVEGAICGLDGLNYLAPEDLPELFRRLHLFLEPGAHFAFDIQSPQRLHSLDGGVFVDETEDALCLWRGTFDPEEHALYYGMDIFSREKGGLWRRTEEEHIEYAHDPTALLRLLEQHGFQSARLRRDGPQGEDGRLFVVAVNGAHG